MAYKEKKAGYPKKKSFARFLLMPSLNVETCVDVFKQERPTFPLPDFFLFYISARIVLT